MGERRTSSGRTIEMPRGFLWTVVVLLCGACTSTPPSPAADAGLADASGVVDRMAQDVSAPDGDNDVLVSGDDVVAMDAPVDAGVDVVAADVPVAADVVSADVVDASSGGDGGQPCGLPGNLCCATGRCGNGGCCLVNRCIAAGAMCPNGAVCTDGRCGDCGGVGQPCCTVGPLGGTARYCTAGSLRCAQPTGPCLPCGAPGQACCARNQCTEGGCCVGGVCTASGATCTGFRDGQPAEWGICAAERCPGCGAAGQPCCAGNGPTGFTSVCAESLTCTDGTCGGCGLVGQPCCGGTCRTGCCNGAINGTCVAVGASCGVRGLGVCRADGSACAVPCGGPGQPCCEGNRCDQGGCCVRQPESGFSSGYSFCVAAGGDCSGAQTCTNGSCGQCGGQGQPCCLPSPPLLPYCSATGTTCDNGCVACGALGQPCCGLEPRNCQTGTCQFFPGRVPCPTCPREGDRWECAR